jgi:uncharacterized protein with NRDE domain
MCLILLAWHAHPDYPLIVAANRDEFFSRPTETARFWPAVPKLLGGCDLQGGGTWLGLTRNGRFAAVTNYREPENSGEDLPSQTRGLLVSEFLQARHSPPDYLADIAAKAAQYRAFNLICGTLDEGLWYYSNRARQANPPSGTRIAPGIHGLSNNLLDIPWPKVADGTSAMKQVLHASQTAPDESALFQILQNPALSEDERLPQTGISLEWERQLSATFVRAPHYGTRSSTLLLCNREGQVIFDELSYAANRLPVMATQRNRFRFKLDLAASDAAS